MLCNTISFCSKIGVNNFVHQSLFILLGKKWVVTDVLIKLARTCNFDPIVVVYFMVTHWAGSNFKFQKRLTFSFQFWLVSSLNTCLKFKSKSWWWISNNCQIKWLQYFILNCYEFCKDAFQNYVFNIMWIRMKFFYFSNTCYCP